MPIVNMTRMLAGAREGRYAVGAFNVLDYASMKAVVEAAGKARAPVIVQTSPKTVRLWGVETMIAWFRDIAARSTVPAAIHLDHCGDLELIGRCIDAGWTSVMIDASSKPFEENVALSQRVGSMARERQVSVEAELGEIGGVEDDLAVDDEDAHLADPRKAREFCDRVGPDCFAPAIGTAHGLYKGEPRIAYDRLATIARDTGVPIALHGGTGLSGEVFRRCIALGCAKVNISTQIKHLFIDSFVKYHAAHASEYDPLKVAAAQMAGIRDEVAAYISLFGGAGRAEG